MTTLVSLTGGSNYERFTPINGTSLVSYMIRKSGKVNADGGISFSASEISKLARTADDEGKTNTAKGLRDLAKAVRSGDAGSNGQITVENGNIIQVGDTRTEFQKFIKDDVLDIGDFKVSGGSTGSYRSFKSISPVSVSTIKNYLLDTSGKVNNGTGISYSASELDRIANTAQDDGESNIAKTLHNLALAVRNGDAGSNGRLTVVNGNAISNNRTQLDKFAQNGVLSNSDFQQNQGPDYPPIPSPGGHGGSGGIDLQTIALLSLILGLFSGQQNGGGFGTGFGLGGLFGGLFNQ